MVYTSLIFEREVAGSNPVKMGVTLFVAQSGRAPSFFAGNDGSSPSTSQLMDAYMGRYSIMDRTPAAFHAPLVQR